MPDWKEFLNGDPLPWLLEEDAEQPGIRYFTLRDILGSPFEEADVKRAQAAIMHSGPVAAILDNQSPEGWWVKPGAGYSPKYTGTVWSLIFLAQLGADGGDPRIHMGGDYVLNNSIAPSGSFSCYSTPSTIIHCLAGNMTAALIDFGFLDDPRLKKAIEWQARLITGDGVAARGSKGVQRYYSSGTSGPLFACSANDKQSCAWGAVKEMLAFGKIPESLRSSLVNKAIEQGVDFLLGQDPSLATYPHPYAEKPSTSWFKFGFPVGYVTDVLQNLEAILSLGLAGDKRLAAALEMVKGKQDEKGRWKMEYSYNGKIWSDIENKGKPSKWVTLRALRVLKMAYLET